MFQVLKKVQIEAEFYEARDHARPPGQMQGVIICWGNLEIFSTIRRYQTLHFF